MASSFATLLREHLPSPAQQQAAAPCGLFVSGSEKAVPLRLRSVNSTVHCDCSLAETRESFAYIADEDVSVVFKFPLPPQSAVHKVEASVGDRTIVAEVKAKEEAQREFDQAVQQGHTAVLAKQETASQMYSLELGNLAAMEEAVVTVSYVRLLDNVGGALEWTHTATWTPAYIGSAGDQQRGVDQVAEQEPKFASKVHYTLSHDVLLLSARGVRSVDSPEPVAVRDEPAPGGGGHQAAKRVTLSEQVADPSKDLSLLIELNPLAAGAGGHAVVTEAGVGQVTVQQCGGGGGGDGAPRTFALATFVPSEPGVAQEGAPAAASLPPLNQELVFVVDCSGSMGGEPERAALQATLFFIKDLPIGRNVRFNVCCFGDHHVFFSSRGLQDVSEASVKAASEWALRHVNSNMGGTEILATFKAVYASKPAPGFTRQIIFLTDGGVSGSEEREILDLAKRHGDVPVHCLGIGHGVHRGLLTELSKATHGLVQCVVESSGIAAKAGALKKAALAGAGAVVAPRLVCGGVLVRAVPHVLPPRLLPGEPVHVLVEVTKGELKDGTVQLRGERGDGKPWAMSLPLQGNAIHQGEALAVLHAMCRVAALQDGTSELHVRPDGATPVQPPPTDEQVKQEVIKVAVAANLVTRHTAAVGVLLQKDPLDPAKVTKVHVPLATPHGRTLWTDGRADQDGAVNQVFRHRAVGFGAMPMSSALYGAAVDLCSAPCGAAPPPPPMMMPAAAPGGCGGGYGAPVASRKQSTAAAGAMAWVGGLFGGAPKAAGHRTRAAGPGSGFVPAPAPAPSFGAPPPPPAASFGAPTAAMFGAASVASPTSGHQARLATRYAVVDRDEVLCESAAAVAPMECDDEEEERCGDGDAYLACDLRRESSFGGGGEAVAAKEEAKKMKKKCEKGGAPLAAVRRTLYTPDQVLEQLNLTRGADGSWAPTEEHLAAVTSQVDEAAGAAARGARPAALSEAQWAAVLALAFLRKHCAGQREAWEGLEGKALQWLQGGWPAELGKSVGAVVLGALRLV